MWWILRMVGNDQFWMIVDGPFQTLEDANRAIDRWRAQQMGYSSAFNVLAMPR